MTAPAEPPLVVDPEEPEEVVRRAGLDLADEQVAQAVQDAIRDATSDAESYLGYPLIPLTATDSGLWPPPYDGEWELRQEPVNTIVQVTAELDAQLQPTGLYTVEYLYGRDAREAEYAPIRRWITAAAAYAHPMVRRLADQAAVRRRVKSVSAEGQSVTYDDGPSTADAPTGGVPPQSSMDRWRLAGRRASTRPGWTIPRPY
ncbi:hypothetical protein [Micromonospora aurantiaca (nom. illeg.)]|uniref:hypothetical protein n=1 Tax=Micromonospora aurantiaca (nom. illeg.) TaxID=47850 RepID=UPI003F49DE45